MRILQVTPFYPPHVGGIEYHVEALSRRLAEVGHQVTVYTSNLPRSKRRESSGGVEVHRFTSLFGPLNNQVMPGLLPKLLGDRGFDLVHAHGYLHLSSNLAVLARLVTRCPLVLTCHGVSPGYQGYKGAVQGLYWATLGRWTLRLADRIIALSAQEAEIVKGLGARPEAISIVPNGIDLRQINREADTQAFRNSLGLDGKKAVLFVGLLVPRKGVEYLIDAARYAHSRPTVLIVGDEPPGHTGNRAALQQRVRKAGLEEQVRFLGSFSRKQVEVAYLASDLFVLPSLSEGLPLVLLEAMAYARPVLASNIPGNGDVIQDGRNGLLFAPGNARELAEKIDRLLEDAPLRARLGASARHDVERQYSWDSVFARILEVYREARGEA